MISGDEKEPALGAGKVEVLPGWSARTRLLHIGWLYVLMAVMFTVTFTVGSFVPPESRAPLMVPLGIFLIACFWSLICSLLASRRIRAERNAGYTTLGFGLPDLPMVDSRTGVILKEAGEPPLDGKVARMRRRLARNREMTTGAAVGSAVPALRVRWLPLVLAVGAVVAQHFFALGREGSQAVVAVIDGALVVLAVGLFLWARASAGRSARRVAELDPGTSGEAFACVYHQHLRSLVRGLDPDVSMGSYPVVHLDETGLSILSQSNARRVTFPWPRVASVRPTPLLDRLFIRRAIEVVLEEGGSVVLAPYGDRSFFGMKAANDARFSAILTAISSRPTEGRSA
ncbi:MULTISPECIES: hypothetical protein [unclassified Rathayibacter]|uniref:hypothetical protein n=1 Tax=unclassified Rathayibacter TaxID=2609250 RepID=UPI000CE7261F|nr:MULTISPECIES: hypothetical protein [unclassified Rathayibacter]PPF14122.1 hypothetical protein C5B92_15530 [Rathayibacter sp. AY1A4]PPG76815.1 hypothetical protein C5C52_15075 [Rathayibacter sp. AY1E5]PPH27288.1 hypothetical protein C5C94_15595 [Rathayibacter sp. AY1C3]PPH52337.1 hypothetical protein C5D25_17330 [Rathayibacter sp. AY1D7]PPI27206.1 hypothetical protein C5D66_16005 [Rathayibacter sp. AY1B4]